MFLTLEVNPSLLIIFKTLFLIRYMHTYLVTPQKNKNKKSTWKRRKKLEICQEVFPSSETSQNPFHKGPLFRGSRRQNPLHVPGYLT